MGGPHRRQYAPGKRDEWRTPGAFVAGVERRWRLILDAAACAESTVAARYIDAEMDALECDWREPKVAPGYEAEAEMYGSRIGVGDGAVWCNPPYSMVGEFSRRCQEQAIAMGRTVLMLAPASVGTAWWSQAFDAAAEVWFVDARLAFTPPPGIEATGNTAGSTLFVFGARPKETVGAWAPTGVLGRAGLLGRDGIPTDPGLARRWEGSR